MGSLKNQRGLGILEITISLGLSSMMMMAMLHMSALGRAETGDLQSKLGQLTLAQDIRVQISKSESCTSAVKTVNYSLSSGALNFDLDLGSGRRVRANENLGNTDSVQVKTFQLRAPATVSGNPAGSGGVVSGDLVLRAQGTKGRKLEMNDIIVGKVMLQVASNQITGCVGESASGAAPQMPGCVGTPSGLWYGGNSNTTYTHGARIDSSNGAANENYTCVAGVWVVDRDTIYTPPQYIPGW